VFTWGRGNYGQLGRAESTNHSPALQSDDSPAVEDVKEASFPREVHSLSGASQVYVTTTPSNLNGILDPHYHYNMCPGQRTSAEDTTGIYSLVFYYCSTCFNPPGGSRHRLLMTCAIQYNNNNNTFNLGGAFQDTQGHLTGIEQEIR